jgi:hypothetical protein
MEISLGDRSENLLTQNQIFSAKIFIIIYFTVNNKTSVVTNMADKKKDKSRSGTTTVRSPVTSPNKDQAEFPPIPPESQLNDRFEKLMVRLISIHQISY